MNRRRLILLFAVALVAWLFTVNLISQDTQPAEPGPPTSYVAGSST